MKRLQFRTIIISLIGVGILHSCQKQEIPTLTTREITDITGTTASSGGSIISEGSSTIISRGVCWGTGNTPTILDNKTSDGAGAGTFSSEIKGLDGATQYFVRAYATNAAGTAYGMAMSFKTLGQIPSAITQAATNITATSATMNGVVNANYLSSVVTFEYGTTESYGTSIPALQNPILGENPVNASVVISELNMATTYHFRIKAENSLGTTYGNDMTFSTLLQDIDGNVYEYIQIGNQLWMKENLKTTKFSDGTNIPNIVDPSMWSLLASAAYCWYDNNISYKTTYGALYNWYTVETGTLCPTGWHIPSDAEWTTVITYLGGETQAGGKLKEQGLNHWRSPNTGATNETNFTALPGASRTDHGTFIGINEYGIWWSATEFDINFAWNRYLVYYYIDIYRNYHSKKGGFSVRCIKDN